MGCCVFAVAAHPDDIELGMAGTLLLLARAGCRLHYLNIADGSGGSAEHDGPTTAAIRLEEARRAAAMLGAAFHPPLVPDLEVFYEKGLLARVSSVMRAVAPDILLVQSPQDYMEDHQNACRLAVTAAFCRGIPNFRVDPPRPPVGNEVVAYHAQPYGNRDPLDRPVRPDLYVDIDGVLEEKTVVLAQHRSQKEWLDHSQGIDSYLHAMQAAAREVGQWSGRFASAEGWRRHNPLGLCAPGADPLCALLGERVLAADP
ncbi:MAG: PIG-L family deacetylase [Candidatus Latescibacterota bacterium]